MMIYIFVLLFLITIGITFNCNIDCKRKKIFICISFCLLSTIAMLRDFSVGIDTEQFTRNFKVISNMDKLSQIVELRYELGFSTMCWILSRISDDPQILIIVTSVFINFCVCRFIYKNSDNVVMSIALYIICNFFFMYMNIMRQALAISIILLGFEYLKKKKYLIFLLFIVLASLFHSSAILALLLILLKKSNFDKQFVLKMSITAFIFFIFGREIFSILAKISPRLFEYVGGEYDVENYFGALINFIIYFSFFILGILLLKKHNPDVFSNKENEQNIYIGIMGAVCIFSILVMRVSIFNRFTPYFSIFLIIWLSNCISKIKNAKNRVFTYVIIFSVMTLYWLAIMMFRPEWYGVVPYVFHR